MAKPIPTARMACHFAVTPIAHAPVPDIAAEFCIFNPPAGLESTMGWPHNQNSETPMPYDTSSQLDLGVALQEFALRSATLRAVSYRRTGWSPSRAEYFGAQRWAEPWTSLRRESSELRRHRPRRTAESDPPIGPGWIPRSG